MATSPELHQGDATKVFNDPIHGHMEFDRLCVKIIDTPQFQRLRDLKQLGGGYFVYPGASHNRFEHSLGVCHLAGLLVTELQRRQPELDITKEDILCVQIAGLCHDLGHGPFSHVFDNKFIHEMRPEKNWKHEDASLAMFDHMVTKNKLEKEFEDRGLKRAHREFIKRLIVGEKNPKKVGEENPSEKESAEGESGEMKPETSEASSDDMRLVDKWTKQKPFLYEIVANKRNGVDVDKWDYFQRDCHHLGMTSSFDHKRFIKFARVITVDGESQICYRDKEAFNMYQLFHTRFTLHRRAYQHKTVQAVELMLVDALKEATEFLKITGDHGECYIADCIEDMGAYTKLTDSVIHHIMLTKSGQTDGHEERAKKIVKDIQEREKVYKCVAEIVIPVLADEFMQKNKKSAKDEIEEMIRKTSGKDSLDDRIRIQVSKLDYGKKSANPVNDVRFFKKDKPNEAVKFEAVEVSSLVPQFCFMEELVRVFFRKTGAADDKQLIGLLRKVGKEWCDQQKGKRPTAKFMEHVSTAFCPTFH